MTRSPDAQRLALLATHWQRLGIDADTVVARSDGTIAAPAGVRSVPELLRSLPLLSSSPSGEQTRDTIELGRTLGRGAMGLVRLARQPALRREVAVKSLQNDADNELAIMALLQEARVTGALEHPNIVPIHTLGRDDDNRPLIVMKRIEGRSWAEALSPAEPPPVDQDDLERHVAVLATVARAVHFAHSRGIVHRDLKPDNVMLGAHGEIYVVDWGLAVRTDDSPLSDLPAACEVAYVAGTAAYMAPEMAAGDGPAIGSRSDVYCLGAILHELVTGSPPHVGDTLRAILEHAFASRPRSYDASVPAELACVCQRAMSLAPADRFSSAAELADALDAFLAHRASRALSDEAAARLEVLRARLLRTNAAPSEQREVIALFSECRFGFQQALRDWPDNESARSGLTATLRLMIEHELAHGTPGAAATLLAELTEVDDALAARVSAARDAADADHQELARRRHDADVTVGDATLWWSALLMAIGWMALCLLAGQAQRRGWYRFDNRDLVALFGGTFLVTALFAWLLRDRLIVNAATRRLNFTLTFGLLAYALVFVLGDAVAMSVPQGMVMMMAMATGLWVVVATTMDRRARPMAIIDAVATAAMAAWPAFGFEILGVAIGLGLTLMARRWLPSSAKPEAGD